jgi:hypothetical protein
MRYKLVIVGALLAALGNPAAAEIKMPPPTGPYASLPFSDVPNSHPAYAAADYLGSLGLPSERPGCYGKRTITRYEFAVLVQRVQWQLRRATGALSETNSQGAQPVEQELVLRQTLADPHRLGEALNWLTPMIQEFAPELRLLEDDAEKRLAEVDRWRREAPELVKRARKTVGATAIVPTTVGAARGPFADLSETHSLSHPCYATADYVSDLFGRGRLIESVDVSSHLVAVDRSRANIAWLRALTYEYRAERELLGKKTRLGSELPEGTR